jgi:hypothetical protein
MQFSFSNQKNYIVLTRKMKITLFLKADAKFAAGFGLGISG